VKNGKTTFWIWKPFPEFKRKQRFSRIKIPVPAFSQKENGAGTVMLPLSQYGSP